ncbi:MAG: UDP-N-acetylmuramate dehydrogenase [Actinomycetota bacterium]|jgi:UDP-N-acetylmuramate dehydrogenase|nr:UDP-N-acetylmuramate dehydrogenase [Actinomycetota bacterium]
MSIDALALSLERELSCKVTRDEPLARFTTYRLGGPAAIYVEPATEDDLVAMGKVLASADDRPPVLAVGRGSNLVISDEGWPGIAVRLGAAFSYVEGADGGARAGGGTALPLLANWAARRGLEGAEFLIAIPGSVGGAVRMNAGAHGREIKDCLRSATIFDLASGSLDHRDVGELMFSYRHSNLSDTDLVLSGTFSLDPADPAEVKAHMEAYRKHRADTQPGAVQNAGSVFRNPPGDHAGRLVEAAGLKGFSVGGARVSELHANFFIAGDGSTAQDVYDLVAEVRRRVQSAHGVDLIPEIRFVGTFVDHPGEVDIDE